MKKLFAVIIAALLLSATGAWAAIPHQINYQGSLNDTGGSPLDTTVAMTFTIYDAATLGTLLWTEALPTVTSTDGLFNALLGSVNAIPDSAFAGTNVWLGVTVGADTEMSPREEIASVGYSYRVGTVDGSTGGTIAGDVTLDGSRLEVINTGQSVFIGEGAGANDNLSINRNVFVGYQAGNANTIGWNNTASGWSALSSNTEGFYNTADGYRALMENTTGTDNTASGWSALSSNTTGTGNTASGKSALSSNTTGIDNTASGSSALYSNTTGIGNTASGIAALSENTTGSGNTASGYFALLTNTAGSFNTALGIGADVTTDSLTNATAIGYNAKVDSSNSLVLGGTGADAVNVGIGLTNPSATLDIVGTVQIVDGNEAVGKVLTSDAGGNATWQTVSAGSVDEIVDADNDTKIQVEESTDEDIIRFDIAGTEFFRMDSARFEVLNSGHSVFIGEGAGANDNLGNNRNVFVGYQAGNANTAGDGNTASGSEALSSNTIGDANTASGFEALVSNTTGNYNTASGYLVLHSNTEGGFNNASGNGALSSNTTGSNNTASGKRALYSNTTGSNNTAIGSGADVLTDNLSNATAIGYNAKVAASNSLVLGGTDTSAVNVGIGTTTPDTTLHVVGSIKMVDGSQAAGYIPVSDDNGTMTWTDPVVLATDDGDWTIVDDTTIYHESGSVGIGTTNPSYKLDVSGNVRILEDEKDVVFSQGNFGNGNTTDLFFNKDDVGFNQSEFAMYNQNNNVAEDRYFKLFFTADSTSNGGLSIRKGGNVGIGTTNPSHKLTVYSPSDDNTLRLIGPDGASGYGARLSFGDADNESYANVYLGENEDNHLKIYAQMGTAIMGGKVGIGTDSPSANLEVRGNGLQSTLFRVTEYGEDVFKVKSDNQSGDNSYQATLANNGNDSNLNLRNNGLKIIAGHVNYDSNYRSRFVDFFKPDGTALGNIRQDGGNSVQYATGSDRRLKTDIRDTRYGLEDLLNIQVADYSYKSAPDYTHTGFIAQQLHERYPEAVSPGGDDPKTDPWMVDYGRVTPLLVKAVQEQQEMIEELQGMVRELQAKLEGK